MSDLQEPAPPMQLGPPAAPPEPLPPPEAPAVSFPLLPVMLAVGATVASGIGLAIAAQIVYIYILYNSAVGWAIAWGLTKAPRNNGFTNIAVLRLLTLFFSVAAYVIYHYVTYLIVIEQLRNQLGGQAPGFIEFVLAVAAHEPFIGGIRLGTFGTFIVWGIEAAITYFVAWYRVNNAIHMHKVEAVPDPVRNYVLQLLAEGRGQEEIERELSKYGWTRHEDQTRALESAQALMTLMDHAQKQKQG